ncbi:MULTISPECIES: iron uptake porin [Spirulina sp. CCY15215]|uniref:iron uptake porin n=1 Tax=Spirulina sp. CCY15215 TaxID=2767591 RepID=UPI0019521B48|nr:iron uptake porin [Spirulina major]
MSEILKKTLLAAPATLGALLFVSGEAMAEPVSDPLSTSDMLQQIESYSTEGSSRAQFTGASKFSDVSPGDWAFQALDDLVRRYDCLKGYPNGTYRGHRALTRYEFAAGLNACLQQIERLIAETTADFVTRDELETLRRLMQEFEAELAALGTRVDNLEGRVAFLEDNQFSTTTKLVGEVIFNLDIATGDRAKIFGLNGAEYFDLGLLDNLNAAATPASVANIIDQNRMIGLFESGGTVDSITLGQYLVANPAVSNAFINDLDTLHAAGNNTATNFRTDRNNALAFGYRARLNFDTSFTGRDRLRTRLQARNLQNISQLGTGTPQVDPNSYGFTAQDDVRLAKLWYRFPASDNVMLHVAAQGINIDDILDAETTGGYAYGGLPLGTAYNQMFYDGVGDGGAAVGANFWFNEKIGLDIGYFATDANDANLGIFGGEFYIPLQLNFNLSEKFKFALGYGFGFAPGGAATAGNVSLGETTSVLGRSPFLWVNSSGNIQESATSISNYHFSVSWDPSEAFNISGFLGYSSATGESGIRKGDSADLWTWGINFGFPDLFKENDVIVASFGQLPYLASANNGPSDRSPSYLASLEYRFPITDNIEMAPGVYAVFNPNGNSNNDTIFVGMLRTTFNF